MRLDAILGPNEDGTMRESPKNRNQLLELLWELGPADTKKSKERLKSMFWYACDECGSFQKHTPVYNRVLGELAQHVYSLAKEKSVPFELDERPKQGFEGLFLDCLGPSELGRLLS